MKELKNVFFGIFFVMFAQGCATVGAISDGVQQGVAGTVDVVLGTTSNVVTTVVDEGSRIGQAGAELVVGVGQHQRAEKNIAGCRDLCDCQWIGIFCFSGGLV